MATKAGTIIKTSAADTSLQSPAKTASPLTKSSHPTSLTMEQSDDYTSGTIVSNLFFSEEAVSAVKSTESVVLEVSSRATRSKYLMPALFNAGLGSYMAISWPNGDWFVFKNIQELCFRTLIGEVCDPVAHEKKLKARGLVAKPCERVHIQHMNMEAKYGKSDPPMTHQSFADALLAEYFQQLELAFPKDTLMTTGTEPQPLRPDTPAPFLGDIEDVVADSTSAALRSVDDEMMQDDDDDDSAADSTDEYRGIPENAVHQRPQDTPFKQTLKDNPFSLLASDTDDDADEETESVDEQAAAPQTVTSLPERDAGDDTVLDNQLAIVGEHRSESTLALQHKARHEIATATNFCMDVLDATKVPENITAKLALAFARTETSAPMPKQSKQSEARDARQVASNVEALTSFESMRDYLVALNDEVINLLMSDRYFLLERQWKNIVSGNTGSAMTNKAKTHLCSHWLLYESCPFDDCAFAHGADELRPDFSNFMNMVVNILLSKQMIDMQQVVEALVTHFVRDDIIELVNAVFDCLNKYAQKNPKGNPSKPYGIYIDDNLLSRMVFERANPRTDPARGLEKTYLTHLLTLHGNLRKFLTDADLAKARASYTEYDFTGKVILLDMQAKSAVPGEQGEILRDSRCGLPIADIIKALVWGYNQCPKNRQFPHHEMAMQSMMSPDVLKQIRVLPERYKKLVQDEFSLDEYCMAGHYGCDHGSHSICGRLSGSEPDMTLLNLDAFFGIHKTKFNANEIQGKMVEYYQKHIDALRRKRRDLFGVQRPSPFELEQVDVQLEETTRHLSQAVLDPSFALAMYLDIEYAKLSAERNAIMDTHRTALANLLRILNESRLDMQEYQAFMANCKETHGAAERIGTLLYDLKKCKDSFAEFKKLCALDHKALIERIKLLDTEILSATGRRMEIEGVVEVRRLVSKRTGLLQELKKFYQNICDAQNLSPAETIKTHEKYIRASGMPRSHHVNSSSVDTINARRAEMNGRKRDVKDFLTTLRVVEPLSSRLIEHVTSKHEKEIARLEAEIELQQRALNRVESVEDSDLFITLSNAYKELHRCKSKFKAITTEWLKVAPRGGSCIVAKYGYKELAWWSSDVRGAAASARDNGIECVARAEPHTAAVNSEALPGPGVAFEKVYVAKRMLAESLALGGSAPLALGGSAPLALGAAQSAAAQSSGLVLASVLNGVSVAENSQALVINGRTHMVTHNPRLSGESATQLDKLLTRSDVMTERTGLRKANDLQARQAVARQQAGLVKTDASYPHVSGSSSHSSGVAALPTTGKAYVPYVVPASAAPSAAALMRDEADRKQRELERRAWSLGGKHHVKASRAEADEAAEHVCQFTHGRCALCGEVDSFDNEDAWRDQVVDWS